MEGEVFVTKEDTSFEALTNYVIKNGQREEKDDGFYMMNMDTIIDLYQKWCNQLPRVRPFYAVKCNCDPLLVRQLHLLGAGFDCGSPNEIKLALSVGSQPSDIVYAHPCKKPSHLRFAADHDVSMIVFDTKEELIKIKEHSPHAKQLLIRIRPTIAREGGTDESPFKYGAAIEDCSEILTAAKDLGLNVVGVSFYIGWFTSRSEELFTNTIKFAREIFDEATCQAINRSLDQYFPVSTGVKIIAEPGTYFADSAFTLVSNIIGVKPLKRKDVAGAKNPPFRFTDDGTEKGFMYFIDDGILGSFAALPYYTDHILEVTPLKKSLSEINYPSCICGHYLTEFDYMLRNWQVPKLSAGDWLCFPNFGAYTSALASNFIGFSSNKCCYYFISWDTWTKMKWTSKDFNADVVFLDRID